MQRNRKPTRHPSYDYSDTGYYFLTINAKEKGNVFGAVDNGSMTLNELGTIAKMNWLSIPQHFLFVELDEFIIMPDHVHGIIILKDTVGNAYMRSANYDRTKMRLSKIIQQYKASVTREIRKKYEIKFQWQKSFYDHIIRKEKSLYYIRKYIQQNPIRSMMQTIL
ncbi:MAG TPA: hypothetical protein PK079_24850 [Leptospiraceae bacterium]|nr:hypothetical protein [Leptospiraceae bacterium]HMW08680.1 hypothetical protein [Leptospiraceae bacterium]HMX34933.1 hypothetical protein [Leptospiraceae bacterium]HMY34393.1 hypothetical protein [Leptospiraceae bacterium]HMZ67198.1 hypothetical protein [Leptospiraceae bacterium]